MNSFLRNATQDLCDFLAIDFLKTCQRIDENVLCEESRADLALVHSEKNVSKLSSIC